MTLTTTPLPTARHRPQTITAAAHPSTSSASTASTWLLLAAMSVALLAQGAYYASVQWVVGLLLAAAAAITFVVSRPARRDVRSAPVVGCALLAGWSLLRGLGGTVPINGLRPALLALGVASTFVVVRRAAAADREILLRHLLLLGGLVALAGWAGVVWHVTPYALTNDGVWRAASTLTYANATAAVLGCLSLVLAGTMSVRERDPLRAALLAVLLVGTGATLSRAGVVSLVAGTLVLLVLAGPRAVVRSTAGPVLGAAIGLLGLLPSMPTTAPAGRPVAVVALVAGVALAGWLSTLTMRARGPLVGGALVLAALVAGVALLAGPRVLAGAVDDVAGWRAHASSPARVEAARAGLTLAAEHPWLGAGPGDGWTSWRGADGSRATMRYVHDEYLQVAVDLGLPGLLLLLVVLGGSGDALRRALRVTSEVPTRGLAAGAGAALATASVHAGFDFVWHLPAIPLLLAAVVGLASSVEAREPATAGPEQKGVVT